MDHCVEPSLSSSLIKLVSVDENISNLDVVFNQDKKRVLPDQKKVETSFSSSRTFLITFSSLSGVDMDSSKKFQTKEQLLHRIQEGISFGDGDDYTVSEYIKMAQEKLKQWATEHRLRYGDENIEFTPEYLEQCYWDTVEISNEEFVVEYGNDVDSDEFGSGFPRSQRGRDVGDNKKVPEDLKNLPEPKLGTDEFYKGKVIHCSVDLFYSKTES